jgi:flagellar biosynthetic protein FlhB
MADNDDDSQKTEDPTQQRLDDALKKGTVPFSREVTSFLMLLVFAFTIISLLPFMMKKTMHNIVRFIEQPQLFSLDRNNIMILAKSVLFDILGVMSTPILIIIIVIILSAILQHGFIISTDTLMPKLERISPLSGVKRIFSMRSVIELIKGLIKISIVGVVAFISVYPEIQKLNSLAASGIIAMLIALAILAKRMLIGICSALFLVAAIDFLYQKFEFIKSLRMSKQDIKEEYKQNEGNPEIKAKLRELRSKRAGKRMMSDVPTADVVVTNPTHYSVALKYESEKTEAPVLVAKGKDLIALKIREIAKENNIPIVENPPLARALFNSVEIGNEIPLEHYNAVAEVIRYVYKLKGKNPKKAT